MEEKKKDERRECVCSETVGRWRDKTKQKKRKESEVKQEEE